MENEIWRPVKGFEGLYEVSSLARVRSLDRAVLGINGSTRIIKGKILNQTVNAYGYYSVGLYRDGKGLNRRVHRIFAEAFIPNPENKPCIDHINRDTKDNRIENLRWCTQKENMNNPHTRKYARVAIYNENTYRKALDTKAKFKVGKYERPVFMYDANGMFLREFKSASEASRETGIDAGTIMAVCLHRGERGKQTAGGYIWSRDYSSSVDKATPYSSKCKRVYQYTRDGVFIREWESVKSACHFYGVHNISRCARGAKDCLCAGFNWRYYKTEQL